MKFVKVMQIPGRTLTVEVADDATIASCVEAAGFTLDGYQLTCSAPASGANAHTVVEDGGSVVLTRQVKGA